MGITSIVRDWGDKPAIVRIVSTDNLATVSAANYILNQAVNIALANSGDFTWDLSDFVLVYASNGWGLFSISSNFNSLTPFALSTMVVGTPVVIGDFAVFQSTSGNIEDLGYLPSDASKTKVVMAGSAVQVGYIAHFVDTSGTIDDTASAVQNDGNIQAGKSGVPGSFIAYPAAASNGSFRWVPIGNSGNFNATVSPISTLGQSTVYTIPDPVASTANFIISALPVGQSVTSSTSSATPGTIRALKGLMVGTNATQTSGNLVGVRGEVDFVGSSTSAFIYGVQGKIIPTGTVASGQFHAGVFGQLDISAATINAGQIAPIWGDYGTSSGTLTNQTGLYGIAMTNTTAAVLQGQLYLYGGAQNLMLLNTNAGLSGVTYFKNSGVSSGSWGNATPPTPSKVLKVNIDGADYYLPLVDQNT